jgi:hypothetical protein
METLTLQKLIIGDTKIVISEWELLRVIADVNFNSGASYPMNLRTFSQGVEHRAYSSQFASRSLKIGRISISLSNFSIKHYGS